VTLRPSHICLRLLDTGCRKVTAKTWSLRAIVVVPVETPRPPRISHEVAGVGEAGLMTDREALRARTRSIPRPTLGDRFVLQLAHCLLWRSVSEPDR
jgi:hypothetical protein